MIVILLIAGFVWALHMLDRVRFEQKEIAASVAAMNEKLDRLLASSQRSEMDPTPPAA